MDITEVRRRFTAYGSGELTESELRGVIRRSLTDNPLLSTAYVALTEAYRRANVIGAELQSLIVADIKEVTGPYTGPTPAAPASENESGATIFSPRRATTPGLEADQGPPPLTGTGPGTTGTGTGSAWDTPERLAEAASPLFLGSVLKSRFELISELGRGGMGVVYKAFDRRTADFKDQRGYVAIKVLNDEFKRHPLAVRSLQREARKAQQLAHPNIVIVHDFDRDGGNVYMVMELLAGHSLDQVIRTEGKGGLPLPHSMQIIKSLGAALSYAHQHDIVHCDFKPSNAFVTEEGIVKVLDFGIARAAPRAEQAEKTIFDAGQLGAMSPPYASPEMLSGADPDIRDDVYALACVSYELLSGRHPFNRIDALKARESGLQPQPIRGLARAQWRGLMQGLAFERAHRTATADAFVMQLTERPRHQARWALAASAVLVCAGAAVVASRQWAVHQANSLEQQLTDSDPQRFAAALAALQAASPTLRARVLLDPATHTQIISQFRGQIRQASAPPRYDYAGAHALVKQLNTLYPDSSAVASLGKQLDLDQQSELTRLTTQRDTALQHGILVASQGPLSAQAAIDSIRRIDSTNAAVLDSRLPALYATAAATAVDTGKPELGQEIVSAALTFAPNDARLLGLQDRVAAELQRTANARRTAQIEQRLSALNAASPGYLDALLANRDDLGTLAALAPSSPTLARIEAVLQTIVQQRIKQQLDDHDIVGARNLLLNVGELLPEQALAAARSLVLQAARTEEDRALDILDRLRSAALTGRIDQRGASGALDLYGQLQRSGASPDVLAEARDLLAYGYLREARQARAAGDPQAAARGVTAGRALQPGPVLQRRLASEQSALGARTASDALATQLDGVRERFAESLRAAVLGPAELAAMAETLDQLEALGSSAQEVDSGLRQIENRVIGEVGRVQQQAGADGAELFARQASAAVPESERIAEIARQLRHSAVSTVARYSPEVLAQRNELADLVARPEASARWSTAIHKLEQKLTSLPADDAGLQAAKRTGVATFVKAAGDARSARKFAEAKNLLDQARSFDADSPQIAREATLLQQGQSAAETAANDAQQASGIEALKGKLASQAAAGDMAGANETANALRRVLGGSVYVARDMPQMLIDGYVHSAKTQLAAGHVDAALQTLAAGRQKFGRAPELKNLETRYVAVGDAYDRLSVAVALNAGEQRRALEALRSTEAGEYPIAERMLALTLANRIADQRAANRGAVVASLLEAGRTIFPAYAAALEQGTAGALPKTGIAISVDH